MTRDYFVILYHPNGGYTPLLRDDDEMMFFSSREEAEKIAESSLLGSEFGYEVFLMGESSI